MLYCCIHELYCTEEYSRTTDEYVYSATYVFVLREWYFFTGAVICVLRNGDIFMYRSLYFCTEINISVLGYILLYWCIFYCTGKYTRTANEYVCVLRYRMQWFNIYLCIAVVGHRTIPYHTAYTSPYVRVQHHAPRYLTIYLYTSPYTPIHHHTPMYNIMHLFIIYILGNTHQKAMW